MKLATRTMRARYCSWCPLCRSPILTGQFISLTSIWAHTSCIIAAITKPQSLATLRNHERVPADR
jgi:hypothetical protein